MATKTEKKVSSELRKQARKLGLCDEWYEAWHDDITFDELISKMITGYDFCVKHDWPDKNYVKKAFPLHVLRGNGVLCDDRYAMSDKRYVVVMGKSVADLYYSDFTFGDVRVRHTSHATVKADALSIVHIHAYEHASVHVDAENGAKVTLFIHSKTVRHSFNGDVKVVYGEG